MDPESILRDAAEKVVAMQHKKISFRGAEATGLLCDVDRHLNVRVSRLRLAELLMEAPIVANEILCERCEERGE